MVFKASMLNWLGVHLLWVYVHCSIYRSAIRCAKFGVAVFKASLFDWGGQSAMGIYALFCIYRSAKIGVVVFKASLLKWGGQSGIDPWLTITPSACQLTIDPCYTITPSPCQSTIDPCYTITPPESAQISVHYAICETYVVQWSSMDLWLTGGGGGANGP